MDGQAITLNSTYLNWCLQQPAVSHHKLTALCPDFLVISPPKTGSTWLAENFRHHPQLFVSKVKEVKYFSAMFKRAGLDWYLDHFARGENKVKGEASPSYALLPVDRIELIRHLMPNVKLIFLMRDPMGRAWSHAKHNYRYREASFTDYSAEFEDITDREWHNSFVHDWPLANGDYLGQLRRWLKVFPREQFHIGFYEDITRRPEALLRELFAFVGVDSEVDLARFPVRQCVLPGIDAALPDRLATLLHRLLHGRTVELASYLREIGLVTPPEWDRSLVTDGINEEVDLFRRAFDDGYLEDLIRLEEAFASSWRPLHDGYQGHNILLDRGRLYAAEIELGSPRLEELDRADLQSHLDSGRLLPASSLAEVMQRLDQKAFAQIRQQLTLLDPLPQQLQDANERLTRLEAGLGEAVESLHHAQATIELLRRPWHERLSRRIRKVWGRLWAPPRGEPQHAM